jgi:hypothetical protein
VIAALFAMLLWLVAHLSPAAATVTPAGPAPVSGVQQPSTPTPETHEPAVWTLPPDPVEVDPSRLDPTADPASDASAADAG